MVHGAEKGHAEANELFELADWALTHSYVLAKFVALATARGVPGREALAARSAASAAPRKRYFMKVAAWLFSPDPERKAME